jgi:hypothetical protein
MANLAQWEQKGPTQYDYAINGIPFLSASTKDYPYLRQSINTNKEQIDTSKEVGEQSLQGYWYRSQSSFDLGANSRFFDVIKDENLARRFFDSHGIDAFTTAGEVVLQRKSILTNDSTAVKQYTIGYAVEDGTTLYQGVLHAYNNQLKQISDSGTTNLVSWGGTSVIRAIETDGSRYFIVANDGVYAGNLPATAGIKMYNATNITSGTIAWAKERIIGCLNNSIYELPAVGTATALPTPLYSNPQSSWTWSAVADGPNGVYFAGYSGDRSYIYRSTLGEDGITLKSPSVVAELPHGEVCYSMITYMGTFVIVGTNLGVRVGLITSDGSIILGPLTLQSDNDVKALYTRGNFCWAGGANSDGNIGLYKIDLSKEIVENSLQFAYQKDVYAENKTFTLPNNTESISPVGMTGRISFAVNNLGIIIETANEKVNNGWLETGKIRLDTAEDKIFQFIRVANLPVDGHIKVQWRDESNVLQTEPLADYDTDDIKIYETDGSDGNPHPYVSYRFTLSRGTVTSNSPVLLSYQVKATPSNVKQRQIRISLLCMPEEKTTSGKRVQRSVRDRIRMLESVEEKGAVIIFQDLNTGEQRLAIIDTIQFIAEVTPETRVAKLNNGGVLILTLRTVDLTDTTDSSIIIPEVVEA